MGQIWALSLIVCPFLGWLVASPIAVDWTLESWRWRSIAGLLLGAGVPLGAAVAAMLRAEAARLGYLVVTLVPIAILIPTVQRLARGPRLTEVVVRGVRCAVHERHTGASGPCIRYRLDVADAPLFASAPLPRSVPERGGAVCVTTLDDVLLEAHPCAP